MADLIRAFIAVKAEPTPALAEILSQLAEFGGAVKPVAADRLHVTLKFLGDIDPGVVAEIGRLLEEASAGVAPFEMRMVGLGAFPHAGRPSVVWTGLQGAESLVEIADRLKKPLKRLGFPPENRPFTPHLTLARVRSKPPDELKSLLSEHAATEFGTTRVESVALYQSELRPDGPRYTVLQSVAFRAA